MGKIIKGFIYFSALLTVGVLLFIVFYIIYKGLPAFSSQFFLDLLPMILNTFYMIIISIVIAAPVGIFSAIYLTEYAKNKRLIGVIEFATECLSGIPSIIYGLFGMIFFVTALKLQFSIISGALTLSIMVLPTIIRTTQESLKSVDISVREGSLALGATRFYTIIKVVLPSAISGILTAIILSIGRIVGETAAVYLTAGMVPRAATSLLDSGRTLAVNMYILAKEAISFEQAYGTAAVLIIVVLIVNALTKLLLDKNNK